MSKTVKVEQHGSLGVLWLIGWLFTVGFLHHGFWKGLLALLIWPYFLGVHLSDVVGAPDTAMENSETKEDDGRAVN